MLQVRLVCPPSSTDGLLGLLAADPGVRNVVVLAAGASRPDGDAIQFDLQTGSANPVLRQLRELSVGEYSPVTVQVADAVLPDPEGRAGWRGRPHLGEIAPVWELVNARVRADAVYAPSFFVLLTIAGLIAAVGILINSQILIVAAMVVGPEYGAIISVAVGIESRDWAPVRTGLIALAGGFVLAILFAFIFALCIKGAGETPKLYSQGLRPVSDLINSPNLFSVVVAVLAGIVGVVSLAESRANALIGVFISVTTIPAAADVGVSLAYHSWPEAGGSTIQLLLNVGLLTIIGALALRFFRRVWHSPARAPN
jgi:uncharacterized hydrophobic protein (TIGR00271 family)